MPDARPGGFIPLFGASSEDYDKKSPDALPGCHDQTARAADADDKRPFILAFRQTGCPPASTKARIGGSDGAMPATMRGQPSAAFQAWRRSTSVAHPLDKIENELALPRIGDRQIGADQPGQFIADILRARHEDGAVVGGSLSKSKNSNRGACKTSAINSN
ncbi:hypothetical protein CCR94_08235 [Rhodoblastus sphagnicola]|uniref:Uncharacterized protein n=1 Tax=Rhodoblastus sphagnicola TaxID=333368 RepID=A0A2S6NAS9_9HYPH|nr:hypothetical protein [Rhodoblastus sphagnicola]MBB4201164.1 hypothetical protein [Rhodoblastus sphagnicola]PPQ31716.1 hypothetical protein CCR94_08235 [Rhodoblastus sphagnicola]